MRLWVNRRSVGAKVLAVTALKAHHATEKAVNEAQDLLSFYSNCRINFDCRARKRPASRYFWPHSATEGCQHTSVDDRREYLRIPSLARMVVLALDIHESKARCAKHLRPQRSQRCNVSGIKCSSKCKLKSTHPLIAYRNRPVSIQRLI